MQTPSLFDELLAEPESASRTAAVHPSELFPEVPQAIYDTWSRKRQLDYCARRDEDSATWPLNADMAEWYRERAQAYRDMM